MKVVFTEVPFEFVLLELKVFAYKILVTVIALIITIDALLKVGSERFREIVATELFELSLTPKLKLGLLVIES